MMKQLIKPSTFFIGLVFGTLVGLIGWYWYKSTSAEDGALDLLDRMAATEARLKTLQQQKVPAEPAPADNYITLTPDDDSLPPFLAQSEREDLQRVKGIGPVFAGKLQAAGIDSLAALTAVSPAQLAGILNVSEKRAENILAESQRLH